MKPITATTVEEYVAQLPDHLAQHINRISDLVRQAVPHVETIISYGMPTYKHLGILLHVAAYEKYIGLYPGPDAIQAFASETQPYQTGKGTLQFPINQELPIDLIKKIIRFRVEENEFKSQLKLQKKRK
jgi:uncharacterized protein YdhG (YjbR/CyaY superfamily)